MRFDIRNVLVLSAFILSSCSSQNEGQSAKDTLSGVIVFQAGRKLEAVNIDTGTIAVLRDSFLQGVWGENNGGWSLSADGASLAFTATPEDVKFFSAAAYRDYLFTVPFDGQQQVLLAAYGLYATKRPYSFRSSSWSADGKHLIVSQAKTGDSPEPSEIAIYDVATRQEIWSSRGQAPRLFKPKPYFYTSLFYPSLSPDGNDVVCFAQEMPNDGSTPEVSATQKAPPSWLVHFDMERKRAEILMTLNEQDSVEWHSARGIKNLQGEPGVWAVRPQFAWHPTQKKFLFVRPVSPKEPEVNLFAFDLVTKKMTRFTESAEDDTSPQWALDGNSVIWLRNYQFFRANADGSNPNQILQQVAGMTKIQLLPKIADWSRYRKLSIEPLAGKDK